MFRKDHIFSISILLNLFLYAGPYPLNFLNLGFGEFVKNLLGQLIKVVRNFAFLELKKS